MIFTLRLMRMTVSIPLSEFCWLKPHQKIVVQSDPEVSIPLSEFCWLKRQPFFTIVGPSYGFNSPLGILLVEASLASPISQCSSPVSIPLSEFCWLKHPVRRARRGLVDLVSIPLSEFCWLKPVSGLTSSHAIVRFQFPSRNSVG